MTETEKEILQTLVGLNQEIAKMATADPKPNLMTFFTRLDELSAQLPETTHPRLVHYMHKRSYEKALLFLSGQPDEIQRGQCDGSRPARPGNG